MNRAQFRKTLISKCRKENGGKIYCVQCGKKEYKENQIVADHINNNDKDHRIKNGQLLCRSHNKKKDPSRLITYLRTGKLTLPKTDRRGQTETLKVSTVSMQKNLIGKPAVFDWLRKKLKNTPAIQYDKNFILSAAKIGNISRGTAEEWIDIETSDEGDYRIRTVKKAVEGKTVTVEYIMTKSSAKDFDSDNQRNEV